MRVHELVRERERERERENQDIVYRYTAYYKNTQCRGETYQNDMYMYMYHHKSSYSPCLKGTCTHTMHDHLDQRVHV